MDFSALKDEYAARGFDYHSDARRGQYVNLARAQLDSAYPWPYLKTTATGSAGTGVVTATDLGVIYLVQDIANQFNALDQASEADLRACWGDLTTAGRPWTFYSSTPGTLTAYPVGGTLKVFYYMVTPDLASPTDTPECPDRYHGLIVDMAVQMAYRDSDDHAMAQQLLAWIDRQTQRMVDDLFADQPPSLMSLKFASVDW